MPEDIYLFLDFDDTLSDFAELGRQYVASLSSRLSHEYGGSRDRWTAAIRTELGASLARYVEKFTGDPLAGFNAWLALERPTVVESIFERAGLELPATTQPGELGLRLQSVALADCDATFAGAAEAITSVGGRVHMASSQESHYLRAALAGTGLEHHIERYFGPDLIDCAKEGPEYYRFMFRECGIRPSQAIVVDDQPQCLDWAEEAGARVVQACIKPDSADPEFPIVIRSLSDLPRLIRMGLT